MKINWKVRLKNKNLAAGVPGNLAAFVYKILGLADIVPAIGEDTTVQLIGIAVESARYAGHRAGPDDRRHVRQRAGIEYTCPADNCRMHKHELNCWLRARLFVSVRGQIICCVRRFGSGSCRGIDCACRCRITAVASSPMPLSEIKMPARMQRPPSQPPAPRGSWRMSTEARAPVAGSNVRNQTDALRTDVLLRRGLQDEAEGGADQTEDDQRDQFFRRQGGWDRLFGDEHADRAEQGDDSQLHDGQGIDVMILGGAFDRNDLSGTKKKRRHRQMASPRFEPRIPRRPSLRSDRCR